MGQWVPLSDAVGHFVLHGSKPGIYQNPLIINQLSIVH